MIKLVYLPHYIQRLIEYGADDRYISADELVHLFDGVYQEQEELGIASEMDSDFDEPIIVTVHKEE